MTNATRALPLSTTLQSLTDAANALAATVRSISELSAEDLAPGGGGAPATTSSRSASASAMALNDTQRRICERVITVFETGSIDGDYAAISIFHDGPNEIRQITYGRLQTTEYGNLRKLVQMYVDAGGTFSAELRPFVSKIGETALVDDMRFKSLLRDAGRNDPIMRRTQDLFFDEVYFQPALRWASRENFTRPLSMLVIYDSFLHSGSIRRDIRDLFAERTPAHGGNEMVWIREYVNARHGWLANHHNPEVRPTIYRTQAFAREIERRNWDLALVPIMAHGVPVDGVERSRTAAAPIGGGIAEIIVERLGNLDRTEPADQEDLEDLEEQEVWSEVEMFVHAPGPGAGAGAGAGAAATAVSGSLLAQRILDQPAIGLATAHPSGANDQATARDNISDTAAGRPARRSRHGTAPGGTTPLDIRLLSGLLALADRFSFSVTELAGGSHNRNSRHYAGLAADVSAINGRPIGDDHPDAAAFQAMCRDLGATEVLGPGDRGHSTHVHAAWPRPH